MEDFTFAVSEPREGIGYIVIGGRISASSVEELGRLLLPKVGAGGYAEVILDCRGVGYISSAGLQVFMRAIQGRKRAGMSRMVCRVLGGAGFHEVLVSVGLSDHLAIRTS